MKLGGFTVCIFDPDTKLQFEEYKISSKTDAVECYIESKTDRTFGISVQLDSESTDGSVLYCGEIFTDGVNVENSPILGKFDDAMALQYDILGPPTGHNKVRPFVFGNTEFIGKTPRASPNLCVEDGQIDKNLLPDLGTIVVELHRIRIIKPSDSFEVDVKDAELKINETAKKALLTHLVK